MVKGDTIVNNGLLQVSALSGMQSYFLNEIVSAGNESWCYHTQFSYRLKIMDLSVPLFYKAVKSIHNRHPVFKTVMRFSDDSDTQQAINPSLHLNIHYTDISTLEDDAQTGWITSFLLDDRNKPFELSDPGKPLFRTFIIKRANDELQFILSISHLIWDGWSLAVYLKEIFDHYHELKLKPNTELEIAAYEYTEFLKVENSIRHSPGQKAFWKDHLKNHRAFTPARHNAIATAAYQPLTYVLSKELVASLTQFHKRHKITLKAVFLGIFAKIIRDESGYDFNTIGVVTNGRSLHLSNPSGTLGLLWNLAPVCLEHFSDDLALLKNTGKALSQLSGYGSYPLPDIMEDMQQEQLFHAAFNFIDFGSANVLPPDSDIEFLEVGGLDKFHFPLHLLVGKNPFNDSYTLVMNYDARCYTEAQMHRKLELYLSQLEKISLQ